MTRLALTPQQKAALIALHEAGQSGLGWDATGLSGKGMRGWSRVSLWSLTYKGLCSWWVYDEVFRCTDEGKLLARMLLR